MTKRIDPQTIECDGCGNPTSLVDASDSPKKAPAIEGAFKPRQLCQKCFTKEQAEVNG